MQAREIGRDMGAATRTLPNRTCVGMRLINAAGWSFIGRPAPAASNSPMTTHVWQMPQGGPSITARRTTWEAPSAERYEGRRRKKPASARWRKKLGEVPGWLDLRNPRTVGGRAGRAATAGNGRRNGSRCATGKDAETNVYRVPAAADTRPKSCELALGAMKNLPKPDRAVQSGRSTNAWSSGILRTRGRQCFYV